jgi:hypothetical protein
VPTISFKQLPRIPSEDLGPFGSNKRSESKTKCVRSSLTTCTTICLGDFTESDLFCLQTAIRSNDAAKSDYTLDATKRKSGEGGIWGKSFYLTLLDRDGVTFIAASDQYLGKAAKDVCHAIKTSVSVEVVDTETLTQSQDARGDTSGGVVGTIVNSTTGRRTHTDTSKIYVIVSGEHALLDCYEHRTGCTTIAPGKYYGQFDGGSIWINYQMPLTHKPLRNHYVIAGSW